MATIIMGILGFLFFCWLFVEGPLWLNVIVIGTCFVLGLWPISALGIIIMVMKNK